MADVTGPETITADELEAFELAARGAFHDDAHPAEVAMDVELLEADRCLVIRERSTIVGTTAALTQQMTVPGGASVPVAAISAVGVAPGHTRRGHLSRLMRRQLDEVEEPLAVLYASEGAIYGRYGYGLSSRAMRYELHLRARASARPRRARPSARATTTSADALPLMERVYEAVRPTRPGLLARSPVWWGRRTSDLEHRRGGAGKLRAAVQHGDDGEPAGYALYSANSDWDELGPSGRVTLRELFATTPEARAGLWDYLIGIGLMRTLTWQRAPEHDPLPHLLTSRDGLTTRANWGLWTRSSTRGARSPPAPTRARSSSSSSSRTSSSPPTPAGIGSPSMASGRTASARPRRPTSRSTPRRSAPPTSAARRSSRSPAPAASASCVPARSASPRRRSAASPEPWCADPFDSSGPWPRGARAPRRRRPLTPGPAARRCRARASPSARGRAARARPSRTRRAR